MFDNWSILSEAMNAAGFAHTGALLPISLLISAGKMELMVMLNEPSPTTPINILHTPVEGTPFRLMQSVFPAGVTGDELTKAGCTGILLI